MLWLQKETKPRNTFFFDSELFVKGRFFSLSILVTLKHCETLIFVILHRIQHDLLKKYDKRTT